MSNAPHVALACALSTACAADPLSSTSAELDFSSGGSGELELCSEPLAQVPIDAPPYVPDTLTDLVLVGAVSEDGTQVQFQKAPLGTTSWVSSLVLDLGGPLDGEPDRRTWADVIAHRNRLRVITDRTPKEERAPRGVLVFDAGRRSLDEVELIEQLQLRVDASGNASLLPLGFDLVTAGGAVRLGHHKPDFGLALTPTGCLEAAIVRYGPVQSDMPPINPPIVHGCEGADCEKVLLAWIRTHHNVWRANQMFEILEDADPVYRSWLWGQPGLDQNGDPVGFENGMSSSSPEYWYGAYAGHRFSAIKEVLEKYWRILRTAETDDGVIDIRLQCPYDDRNGCSVNDAYGHHVVKGWVNICNEGLTDAKSGFSSVYEAVTATVRHELLHHVFVRFKGGTRAIKDTFTHGHGSTCLANLQTEVIYGEDEVRELATYVASDGESCWHQDLALQTAESHALFAHAVGTMVKTEKMWTWPKHADPTPQPPACYGDPGCLCYETQLAETPDGDYSSSHFCPDHDGVATCVETEVNAGAIVGICNRCEDERGPGCDCNDLDLPCDVGSCFGDDTHGNAAGTGKCYLDAPPAWACLADCERLFNDPQAYCYNDHPGARARCMDSDCPQYLAYNCAQQGLICRDGACVQECGDYVDGDLVTCQDLGYPSYYECSGQFRCEPNL